MLRNHVMEPDSILGRNLVVEKISQSRRCGVELFPRTTYDLPHHDHCIVAVHDVD